MENYHLRYLRRSNGLYEKLAFVDMSMERAMLREMMASYLFIGGAALLLLLAAAVLLSWWATRPVEQAWRQQRQFLSDASHELKTPLTVILSNAEMLDTASLEDRPARWADNIRSEARRMKTLVEEMLTLARADNLALPPPSLARPPSPRRRRTVPWPLIPWPLRLESPWSTAWRKTSAYWVTGRSCGGWCPSCWTTPLNTVRPAAR